MRYQKANPDLHRKPDLKTCNGDDPDDGAALVNHFHTEAKSLRGRPGSGSATQSPARDLHFHHVPSPSYSPAPGLSGNLPPASASPSKSNSYNETNEASHSGGGGGEDVLLQWGQNKRSRRSRTEGRSPVVVSSAGGVDESSARPRQGGKIPRRSALSASEKVAAAGEMPPPSISHSRSGGGGLRPSAPLRDATSSLVNNGRAAEERSTVVTRSEKRPPASSSEKSRKKPFASGGGGGNAAQGSSRPESKQQQQQEAAVHGTGDVWAAAAGDGEKLRLDRFQWPRIYVSLSRKEKEDDFLAMKGTKLPQRPKKRAKNVDKTLQYCFPGMWLSDLTRGRYEVREKKCVKKKRRGLKGMENMDSDSD